MASDRWFSNPTQVYWCCKALLDGRTITHKTEFREVNGWRLGAIVHTLKSKYEWPIVAEYRGTENIAHYRLASDIDRARLKFPPSAKVLSEEGGAA
ncbi:hypothetical protein [Puniceibacterium confluentis]|uniref:hypothetical protein n=1 Tax=Puniceibacterium confluentis TaxID=1958944 RepID=UPI001FE4D4D3|nr:hypothetical protein [Puniceibacterium confluentis]